jgi:hypothetical protein
MRSRIPSLVAAGAATAVVLRRVARRTGVSDAEVCASLPGDDVIAHPMLVWDRGVTIDRSPAAVWPWLAQMGYGRAGYYTPEAFDGGPTDGCGTTPTGYRAPGGSTPASSRSPLAM